MPDLDVNGSKSSLFFCVVHLDKELCSTLSLFTQPVCIIESCSMLQILANCGSTATCMSCVRLNFTSVHHYLEAFGIYIIDSLFFCMPG